MENLDWCPNYAGREDVDDLLIDELTQAGILYDKMPESWRTNHPEMRTIVIGNLHGWTFTRNWNYWIARGPGISLEHATKLHETHGKYVRVDGHCGCPSPLEWFKGLAVGHYHVDTLTGLRALADTIRLIVKEANFTGGGVDPTI